jgi:MFS family permease
MSSTESIVANSFAVQIGSHGDSGSPYCKYDDHIVQLFVSCLFIAGAVGAVIASHTSTAYGRRITLMWGGIAFFIGAVLQATAVHVAMLIIGRLGLGLGVGLSAQAAPVFLSEMAPFHLRGAMNIMFQVSRLWPKELCVAYAFLELNVLPS